ncbi:NAD(P)H-quinone oxidoreductase subunit H [Acrasis kona]|uniref:NAD(P)H-quinone oxidoreductase subunit H n=1 Tax=Acrasis kona TaxID=1008807 RepID=A0AAW2ZMV6_9EUKA
MNTIALFCFLFALSLIHAQEPRLNKCGFETLRLGTINPEGWLKDQLFVQADGYSRRVDEDWPDVAQSGWIGGMYEGWERFPYYLDGFVGLAVQTKDKQLLEKLHKHVGYIVSHQDADGWLGPVEGRGTMGKGLNPKYDPWPQFCILKSLIQYAEAFPENEKVTIAIGKSLRKIEERLSVGLDPFIWAKHRWQDAVVVIQWYFDHGHAEQWLLDLTTKLQSVGFDWIEHYHNFKWTEKVNMSSCFLPCHGVNSAQSVKTGLLLWRQTNKELDADNPKEAIKNLERYHGMPSGIFSSDELYAGLGTRQGAELCTVVEYMYSLEVSAMISGTKYGSLFGDVIERVAFNSLPATFDPAMNYHQYVQQTNQVTCKMSETTLFTNVGNRGNLYGKAPHFGCCTANYHQGWPKFVQHLWMKQSESTFAAVLYAPSSFTFNIKDQDVTFRTITNYPFLDGLITIQISNNGGPIIPITLLLRIPEWSSNANVTYNGQSVMVKSGTFHQVSVTSNSTITLNIPLQVRIQQHSYKNAISIHRGPLLFSLGLAYKLKKIENCKHGECDDEFDFEVTPLDRWNYALKIDKTNPDNSVKFITKSIDKIPFNHLSVPVLGIVKAKSVTTWTLDEKLQAAGEIPDSPVKSDEKEEELVLVPFGSTNARIAMFPTLE